MMKEKMQTITFRAKLAKPINGMDFKLRGITKRNVIIKVYCVL